MSEYASHHPGPSFSEEEQTPPFFSAHGTRCDAPGRDSESRPWPSRVHAGRSGWNWVFFVGGEIMLCLVCLAQTLLPLHENVPHFHNPM